MPASSTTRVTCLQAVLRLSLALPRPLPNLPSLQETACLLSACQPQILSILSILKLTTWKLAANAGEKRSKGSAMLLGVSNLPGGLQLQRRALRSCAEGCLNQ